MLLEGCLMLERRLNEFARSLVQPPSVVKRAGRCHVGGVLHLNEWGSAGLLLYPIVRGRAPMLPHRANSGFGPAARPRTFQHLP